MKGWSPKRDKQVQNGLEAGSFVDWQALGVVWSRHWLLPSYLVFFLVTRSSLQQLITNQWEHAVHSFILVSAVVTLATVLLRCCARVCGFNLSRGICILMGQNVKVLGYHALGAC